MPVAIYINLTVSLTVNCKLNCCLVMYQNDNLQKHQDAFASAFGFFLIGFDAISKYGSLVSRRFFSLTDPVLWFFKVCYIYLLITSFYGLSTCDPF